MNGILDTISISYMINTCTVLYFNGSTKINCSEFINLTSSLMIFTIIITKIFSIVKTGFIQYQLVVASFCKTDDLFSFLNKFQSFSYVSIL
jgi:hypothetical protein